MHTFFACGLHSGASASAKGVAVHGSSYGRLDEDQQVGRVQRLVAHSAMLSTTLSMWRQSAETLRRRRRRPDALLPRRWSTLWPTARSPAHRRRGSRAATRRGWRPSGQPAPRPGGGSPHRSGGWSSGGPAAARRLGDESAPSSAGPGEIDEAQVLDQSGFGAAPSECEANCP